MKYKVFTWIFSFSMIILSGFQSYAQLTSIATTVAPLTQVTSNVQTTSLNAFRLQINIPKGVVYHKNWSLFVKVNGNIKNSEGRNIPASNISMRVNSVIGAGNLPTVAQLGTVPRPLISNAEVAITNKVDWEITSGGQNMLQFSITFDIIIAPNTYDNFRSDNNYNLENLTFVFRETNGTEIKSANAIAPSHSLRIFPIAPPPVYSIQVNLNANSGLLEFKSIGDYVNGVSQTYADGLTLSSSTPYELQVIAQTSAFESATSSIPISIVSLNLKDPVNGLEGTVVLSNNTQNILTGNEGTQNRSFDIRYFTVPNDPRLQNAKPDTYRATLLYTLIPQ